MSEIEKMDKTIDENYDNLKAVIMALTSDYEKFNKKKVKAAGQRVRSSLLNTKKLCDTLRKQVKEEIATIPVKHRSKSPPSSSEDSKGDDEMESKPEEKVSKPLEDKPKRKRKANKKK